MPLSSFQQPNQLRNLPSSFLPSISLSNLPSSFLPSISLSNLPSSFLPIIMIFQSKQSVFQLPSIYKDLPAQAICLPASKCQNFIMSIFKPSQLQAFHSSKQEKQISILHSVKVAREHLARQEKLIILHSIKDAREHLARKQGESPGSHSSPQAIL